MREGESLVVKELAKVGIEPFKISLVRVTPSVPPAPTLKNSIKAVDIVSVQSEGLALPSYQLTIRNVSGKNIGAIAIGVEIEGKNVGGSFLEGDEGRPLVLPGDLYTAVNLMVFKAEKTVGGYSPANPTAVQLVINGVAFSDGTYDGSIGTAQLFQAKQLGRKTFIRAFLSLLDKQIKDENNDKPEALLQFKERVAALQAEFDGNDVKDAIARAPYNPKPTFGAEGTIRFLRRQVLGDLETYEGALRANRGGFKAWLEATRQKYADWFARL
jgi:hypothetical protein